MKIYTTIKYLIKKLYKKILGVSFLVSFVNKLRMFINKTFVTKRNMEKWEDIKNLASSLPSIDGCSYYTKADITIAIITDEFMYNYYKDAVNLIYITPSNYKHILEQPNIDYVLFVSCWRGIGNSNDWYGHSTRKKVIEIFEYAKMRKITCIFQSIEDPSNYDEFIEIAKKADYIFTSCNEVIDKYIHDTDNPNVFILPYGINPYHHNPIGCFRKHNDSSEYSKYSSNLLFAGSWASKYKQRCNDLKAIFVGVIESGRALLIADRNYNTPGYQFPLKYSRYIIPAFCHTVLQSVHKLVTYNINANSITESDTMCAMRIYELQALGSLLFSNYSKAVSNTFPNIFLVTNMPYIKNITSAYNINEIKQMQTVSIRNVFTDKTVYDRLNYIFKQCKKPVEFRQKKVYIITDSISEKLTSMVKTQVYSNIEIVMADNTSSIKPNSYYMFYNSNSDYHQYYIQDLINGFKFSHMDFVEYNNLCAYEYIDINLDCYSSLYDSNKVKPCNAKAEQSNLKGLAVYNTLNNSNQQGSAIQIKPSLAVIIPVYNNGIFLRDRCFSSLLRSSIFELMQIYIIDDGSTDCETINIIHDLKSKHNNIDTYFFNGQPSGSASRPRNKGIELCGEEYVTFLDPDNEAINDGYDYLLNIVQTNPYDMVFGTIYKIQNGLKHLSYMKKSGIIQDPKKDLIKRDFRTQSIQACVIKKSLITEFQITNPIGALGQDTLFFHELMLNAEKAYHTTLPIHIYYADRSSSVVNSVSVSFFKKSLITEEHQVGIYSKHNVLEEYKCRKLKYFINNWYYAKLEKVNDEIKADCQKVIDEIATLYKDN